MPKHRISPRGPRQPWTPGARILTQALLVLVCVILSPCAVWAKSQPVVRVTTGEHPNFGRVVLDAPGLGYTVNRDGDHLLIRFPDDPAMGELPPPPRNVLAIREVPGGVELTMAPGANVHATRMGAKVVVDIDDVVPNRTPVTPPADAHQPRGNVAAPATAPPVPERRVNPPPPLASPMKLGAPPAVPSADDAARPKQGLARSDSASSADPGPATSAPSGADAAPAPRATESSPPAEATPSRDEPSDAAGTQPASEQSPQGPPQGSPQGLVERQPEPDSAVAAQSGSIQVGPVTRDAVPSGPVALLAVRVRPPRGLPGVAVRFPFTGAVGAALFSQAAETFVVFDTRRPIDLSAFRDDPVFGSAVVTIYPTATVVRLTRPPGQSAMLFPAQLGWSLSVVPALPTPAAILPQISSGVMTFAADAPGQVVAITDPRTGGTLLVGTQRTAGQAVLVERRTPEFILPVTGQGLVVVPLSDALELRITQAGFVLSGGPSGLALSAAQPVPEATLAAAGLTRLFEFPRQTTEDLARRAKRQAVAAAMAPLLTRGPKRHAQAESMLGLGLGAEVQTLLRITMKDDPREAASPTTVGLAAIAALLAGRPREAGELADPRLTGTDEIAMWRAIQTAMSDEASPAAAAVLATTAPLLFTYPTQMRRRVLPLAMETLVLGGQAGAAAPLLAQQEDDPDLAYARALLKQATGDNEAALALLDAVTNTRSDFDHARAEVRAAELRLTMGKLDAKGAADALETGLYAWRGDRRDLALRLRIAELREQSGAWRAAFTMLRDTKTAFPDQVVEIDRRLREAFAAVPHDPSLDKMEPTELIALLGENTALMADGPDGEPMRALLAEKLMALDLPKQADPLLTKLMRAAPFGPARAEFGSTLAALRMREGDADGAILALSESNSGDMPDAVRERRTLITARVQAKRGHAADAAAALSADKTPEAEETRAAILEHAQDWPAARDALSVLATRVVPDSGMLNAAQLGVVLRLATAATHADDDATLASLGAKLGTRVGTGPRADMFRLLTAAPVRGTADLARARAEMGLARAVSAGLNPKPPAAKTP